MPSTKSQRKLGRDRKPRHRSGPAPAPEVRFRSEIAEVREAQDNPNIVEVVGQPIVYDTPYKVRDMLGEFEETIAPGVVTDILSAGVDCRYLFNHEGLPLARTTSGTLVLEDTPHALNSVARLDTRQRLANDLVVAIERGDISQMSHGFICGEDQWNDGYDERRITRYADLLDVSPVTYPASPTTSVTVAKRMLMAQPLESRSRMRQLWYVLREMREGKVLSAANAKLLADALEALHEADDTDLQEVMERLGVVDSALDRGQAAISSVLGKANPDDDEAEERDGDGDAEERDSRHGSPDTAAARRDVQLSYGDTRQIVYEALCDSLGEDRYDIWILDIGDGWVVYESWDDDGTYRVAYTIDGTSVTITGDPEPVVGYTTWVPRGEEPQAETRGAETSAEAEPAEGDEPEAPEPEAAEEAEDGDEPEAGDAPEETEAQGDEPEGDAEPRSDMAEAEQRRARERAAAELELFQLARP